MPASGRPYRSSCLTRLVAGLAAGVVVAAGAGTGVATAQPEAPGVGLRLVEQPPWHGPRSTLGMTVLLTNHTEEALDGFNVRVEAHARVRSRSALGLVFEGNPGFQTSSYTLERTGTRIEPGDEIELAIDDPLENLAGVASATEGGVFPIRVALYDGDGARLLDSFITPLVYYPRRPENRLNLVPVIPLHALPARSPEGVFGTAGAAASPLETALAPGGWLEGVLAAAEEANAAGLRLALAPTPRLVEEIGDLADGYRREEDDGIVTVGRDQSPARSARSWMRRLNELVAEEGVQLLLTPYAFPDLPALATGPSERLLAQIATAELVLEQHLGGDVGRAWIFPPGGRIDRASLDELNLAGAADGSVFAPDVLDSSADPAQVDQVLGDDPGCAPPTLTFACPIVLSDIRGVTDGYVTDEGIQERVGDLVVEGDDAVDLQKIYAETSMIHAELPGTLRVVSVVLPALWEPHPRVASDLFDTFARAPWLRTVTAQEGVNLGIEPVERDLVRSLPAPSGVAPGSLAESIEDAERVTEAFGAVEPPEELFEQLRRNVLVAQSSSWWIDAEALERGESFATTSRAIAERELGKIRLGAAPQITLTSEQGDIQFSLANGAEYPVTVQLELDSRDLDVEDTELERTIRPGVQDVVNVRVRARSSGIFPLDVRLQTPVDPGSNAEPYLIESLDLTVRSTTFNDIAVAITLGALAFLVLFYAFRALRRRGTARDESAQAPAT